MILPLGKPPPKAMSSVRAPLGIVSLHNQFLYLELENSHTNIVRNGHNIKLSVVKQSLLSTGTDKVHFLR